VVAAVIGIVIGFPRPSAGQDWTPVDLAAFRDVLDAAREV
jgi:hypothetical protein